MTKSYLCICKIWFLFRIHFTELLNNYKECIKQLLLLVPTKVLALESVNNLASLAGTLLSELAMKQELWMQ